MACAPYEASMPPVFPIGSDGTRSRMTTRKVNLILSENLECVYFYQP